MCKKGFIKSRLTNAIYNQNNLPCVVLLISEIVLSLLVDTYLLQTFHKDVLLTYNAIRNVVALCGIFLS